MKKYYILAALIVFAGAVIAIFIIFRPISVSIEASKNTKINCTYKLYDFVVDDKQRVYVADKAKVFVINESGKKEFSINSKFKYCTSVAVNNNAIYAFDSSGNLLKVFTINGRFIKSYKVANTGLVERMVFNDDKIYMLQPEFLNFLA